MKCDEMLSGILSTAWGREPEPLAKSVDCQPVEQQTMIEQSGNGKTEASAEDSALIAWLVELAEVVDDESGFLLAPSSELVGIKETTLWLVRAEMPDSDRLEQVRWFYDLMEGGAIGWRSAEWMRMQNEPPAPRPASLPIPARVVVPIDPPKDAGLWWTGKGRVERLSYGDLLPAIASGWTWEGATEWHEPDAWPHGIAQGR